MLPRAEGEIIMSRVPQNRVLQDLCHCHTKRKNGGWGPANPSFGMTTSLIKGALYSFLQGDIGWPILALLDTGEQPVQAVLRSLNQRTYSHLQFHHMVCPLW